MPTSGPQIPKYRMHKASGQAAVVLDGEWIYLGLYDSPESREKCDRLVAEWLVAGRRRPTEDALTVGALIIAYWQFAETYYRKNGRPTDELGCIRAALRPLRRLYGRALAGSFGPLALKAVRVAVIREGWCRKYINDSVGRIKRLFRWVVENELLAPAIYQGLQAVPRLRRDRSEARETAPIRPVPSAYITAVLPRVAPEVAAMIELQLLTGMRAAEVTATAPARHTPPPAAGWQTAAARPAP